MILESFRNSDNLQNALVLPQEILPKLILAALILLVGFFLAYLVQDLFVRVFKFLNKINDILDKIEFCNSLKKAGIKIDVAKFLGVVFKIFIILVALVVTFDVLGLQTLNDFLVRDVLEYIPNVVIASVVLILGIIFANWIYNFVEKLSRVTNVKGSFAAGVAKYAVLVFTFVIAVSELGIAPEIIRSLVIGFITAISLAVGLAFGLGGQDTASRILGKLEKDLEEKPKRHEM